MGPNVTWGSLLQSPVGRNGGSKSYLGWGSVPSSPAHGAHQPQATSLSAAPPASSCPQRVLRGHGMDVTVLAGEAPQPRGGRRMLCGMSSSDVSAELQPWCNRRVLLPGAGAAAPRGDGCKARGKWGRRLKSSSRKGRDLGEGEPKTHWSQLQGEELGAPLGRVPTPAEVSGPAGSCSPGEGLRGPSQLSGLCGAQPQGSSPRSSRYTMSGLGPG